jgi:16S rRNA (cytosine967-C5)-methyltransferase
MPTPARRLAHRVLVRSERAGPVLSELLADPEIAALPARERDFLQELVLGSLRRRGALDHALGGLVDRRLDTLDAEVRAALRLGAYQIAYLRVPDRAAVFESVELVRRTQPRAAGFVNATLRRLAREGAPAAPRAAADPLGWMTSEGSLPRWLASRWLTQLGAETAVLRARALLEPPITAFRLNPRAKSRWNDIAAELDPVPLAVPGAFRARRGRTAALAAKGDIYVQDQGSQLIAHLAASSGRVLDACAAPGGKATLLADASGDGLVIAAEASRPRLATMAELLARWGAANVRCVGADALRPPFGCAFDAVLLDAPCSGLGTLARHPDIRWRFRHSDLKKHAGRQRAMLESLAPRIAAHGLLVYAVCSLEPEETTELITSFLDAHPEFEPAPHPPFARPFSAGAFLETTPETHGGDGFFAAPLRRVSGNARRSVRGG